MNKSTIKMTVIASSIIILLGGSYLCYKKFSGINSMLEKEISSFAQNLPKQITIISKEKNFSLLETTGVYELSYKNNIDKNYNGSVVIEYQIPHTFGLIFGDTISFIGTAKFDGNIVKTLKIKTLNNQIFKLSGSIQENGAISLEHNIDNLSFSLPHLNYFHKENSSVDIKFDKIEGAVQINPEISSFNSSFNYKNVTISNRGNLAQKTAIKDVSGIYQGDLKNLSHGKLNLNLKDLSQIENSAFKIKEVKIENIVGKNKEDKKLHDISLKLNISEMKTGEQNANIVLDTTLEKTSNELLNFYQNIVPIYFSSNKISENEQFLKTIKQGFNLKVKQFNYVIGEDSIDLNGNIGINPYNLDMTYSLAKTLNVSFDLKTKGELLDTMLHLEPSTQEESQVKVEYIDTTLKINDELIEGELAIKFSDFINNIGKENNINK